MLNKLFSKFNKKKEIKQDEYSCTVTEAVTADKLHDILKKELSNAIKQQGENIEYVIMSSDSTYSILFSSGISRIRVFNRINYLLEESMGYKMRYELASKTTVLYGLGSKIVVTKIMSNTN